MKTSITVTELTHDELVNIFSTAFYGCNYLRVDYDPATHKRIPKEKRKGRCFEDALADLVLNGGRFTVYDLYAEGEVYGSYGKIDPSTDEGVYVITLARILKGCSTEMGYEYLKEILRGDGDYFTGNNLMQIIMFGEVIYG